MATNYIPRPGSLAAHACAWFKVNPGRQLTLQQICGRWGGTAHTASAQLGAAEDAEFLLSERIGRNDVYSAGPKLASWTPLNDSLAESAWNPPADPLAAPAPAAAPATPAGVTPANASQKTRKPRDLPAPDAIVIERNVPIPKALRGGDGGRYDDVFARMKPGESFACTPAQGKPLFDAAKRWAKRHGKGSFALRKVDDNTSRLWRTE